MFDCSREKLSWKLFLPFHKGVNEGGEPVPRFKTIPLSSFLQRNTRQWSTTLTAKMHNYISPRLTCVF